MQKRCIGAALNLPGASGACGNVLVEMVPGIARTRKGELLSANAGYQGALCEILEVML